MLSVVIGVNEYSLDDGSLCRLVGHAGWGMAPQHRLSQRGPMQHGESDRGYRLDPRYGSLILQLESTDLGAMYDLRESLLALFKPGNSPKLKWTLPNGKVRQFDCHYYDDMGLDWEPGLWAAQRLAVTLKCPDPTCYDPVLASVPFGISGGGSGWVIPWAIPWSIGQSTIDQTTAINYAGSFLSYPVIKIVGPITNPVITNTTTGEKLDFTGASIADGSYYLIDCRYEAKSVVDNTGTNRADKLTTDSHLTTFHLATDPDAPGGINSIRVAGSGVNANTQVYLQYYDRFVGL